MDIELPMTIGNMMAPTTGSGSSSLPSSMEGSSWIEGAGYTPPHNEGGEEVEVSTRGTGNETGASQPAQAPNIPPEGGEAPEPSTARAPVREEAHEPSTSSTWSGSWIEKWLDPEVSSSTPNQGQLQQGETGVAPEPVAPNNGEGNNRADVPEAQARELRNVISDINALMQEFTQNDDIIPPQTPKHWSMIISKVSLNAFQQHKIPVNERVPFLYALYVDLGAKGKKSYFFLKLMIEMIDKVSK